MNKKLKPLISIALIIIISIPVFSIVFARKPDKGPLEKIVYIHYKKGHAKPSGTPGVGPDKDKNGEEGHYTFLAKGVKWPEENLPVEYVINPNNPDPEVLTDFPEENLIIDAIFLSTEEWDNYGIELFGSYTVNYSASWDTEAPDYKNELVFGDYPQDGVIAVCIVWGYFTGPPSTRKIVEFDIMFDTDYIWGYAGETNETGLGDTYFMDLQNIATHELGHGVGLGDLYDNVASEETMYGRSTEGETKKRTLYIGDIAGIQALYGE